MALVNCTKMVFGCDCVDQNLTRRVLSAPATYMHKVTKIVYVETDLAEAYQSYEVSCHDKNLVPCPLRFSCPAQGRYRENKYVRANRRGAPVAR